MQKFILLKLSGLILTVMSFIALYLPINNGVVGLAKCDEMRGMRKSLNKDFSLMFPISLLRSRKNSSFYVFSTEGIFERALDILPIISSLEISHDNLLDI